MRDYVTMRNLMIITNGARSELCYNDFRDAGSDDKLQEELVRLTQDGLLEADVSFGDGFSERTRCTVSKLSPEGVEFFKLVENDEVWEIILATLKKARIDVSYPLLKEVCEEIVKRYVTSFIPEI